jgi:signal transduction histidine kinase
MKEREGGAITAKSSPGIGTAFIVTFAKPGGKRADG